jgi:hypothetical protein
MQEHTEAQSHAKCIDPCSNGGISLQYMPLTRRKLPRQLFRPYPSRGIQLAFTRDIAHSASLISRLAVPSADTISDTLIVLPIRFT